MDDFLDQISNGIVSTINSTAPPKAVMDTVDAWQSQFVAALFANENTAPLARTAAAWMKDQHALVRGFPLMNPFHVVLILLAYLTIVYGGRLLMKPFNPFAPRLFQIVHNLFLTLLSLFMVVECVRQARLNDYQLLGNGIGRGKGAQAMARIVWIFYWSKIPEFIDTFIMVLKKSERQISFLHVYHHTTIFAIWWAVSYFGPGGDAYLCVILNSFVHVVMYSYYLSQSAPLPAFVKNGFRAIRPYITQMQMLQFMLMMVQATYGIVWPAKTFPYFLYVVLFVYMITLLALFYNFYRNAYKAKKAAKKKTQ